MSQSGQKRWSVSPSPRSRRPIVTHQPATATSDGLPLALDRSYWKDGRHGVPARSKSAHAIHARRHFLTRPTERRNATQQTSDSRSEAPLAHSPDLASLRHDGLAGTISPAHPSRRGVSRTLPRPASHRSTQHTAGAGKLLSPAFALPSSTSRFQSFSSTYALARLSPSQLAQPVTTPRLLISASKCRSRYQPAALSLKPPTTTTHPAQPLFLDSIFPRTTRWPRQYPTHQNGH